MVDLFCIFVLYIGTYILTLKNHKKKLSPEVIALHERLVSRSKRADYDGWAIKSSNMETERKYVAYYRISKDSYESGRSKSKGLGLEAQRQIVEHFYKDAIVKDFTETRSAKNISERPVLQEAIQYCVDNGCWLVVAKLDRLSRNTIDALSIVKRLNKKISFCDIPGEGEVDEFMITIFAAIAQRERELISLRTRQALQIKLKRDGKWQRGSKPFMDGSANKMSVAANRVKADSNENTIRAAQLILVKRNAGMIYVEIAKLLNENRFLTPTGMSFYPTQVMRIYNNQIKQRVR